MKRSMNLKSNHTLKTMILMAGLVLLTGCNLLTAGLSGETEPTSEMITETVPVEEPTVEADTPTPTPQPLGSEQNPLIMGIVSNSDDPLYFEIVDQAASEITERAKLFVRAEIYSNYNDLLTDLEDSSVQIAWLPPLTYLHARAENLARVGLLTNHFGVYQFNTQFLANTNSRILSYYDEDSDISTGNEGSALAQFAGLRPCWVDESSVSGYVLPSGLLNKNNVEVKEGVFIRNHAAVVRALYIGGICDFGVTFAGTGDPRTSSSLQDLPDVFDRIEIVWQSDAVIPNLNVSYQTAVPGDVREVLNNALFDIATTEEGKQLLSEINAYEINGLKVVDDNAYTPLRDSIAGLEIDLVNFLGQ